MRCAAGTKKIEYGRVDIHLHYCNHAKIKNVTVTVVPPRTPRPRTAKYPPAVIIRQWKIKCGGNSVEFEFEI